MMNVFCQHNAPVTLVTNLLHLDKRCLHILFIKMCKIVQNTYTLSTLRIGKVYGVSQENERTTAVVRLSPQLWYDYHHSCGTLLLRPK